MVYQKASCERPSCDVTKEQISSGRLGVTGPLKQTAIVKANGNRRLPYNDSLSDKNNITMFNVLDMCRQSKGAYFIFMCMISSLESTFRRKMVFWLSVMRETSARQWAVDLGRTDAHRHTDTQTHRHTHTHTI